MYNLTCIIYIYICLKICVLMIHTSDPNKLISARISIIKFSISYIYYFT